jgi:pre-mRNA-splicing factor ISY1
MQREQRTEKSWEKPSDPGTVQSLAVCERWRQRICEDIDSKLQRLYNEPLPEAETRYLNDEVNKILREIRAWEMRIVELGGIDYSRVSRQSSTGDLLNTNVNHYQYFGRARDLPGVRELLELAKKQRLDSAGSTRKINKDALLEKVDVEYYGLIEDKDLEEEARKFEEDLGAIHAEPDLQSNPIPSDESIRRALEVLLSGRAQSVTVE